ncbi:MAG TPA: phosphate acyltransferase [Verrucomicrobiales bacterium]|nr:phosphate acyltransferase [Verrucomicrobiales bacterium]
MSVTPFHQENHFTSSNIAKLSRHPKRIVFPEPDDERILRVARELTDRRIIAPILVGDRAALRERAAASGLDLKGIGVVNPRTSSDLPQFCYRFERMERFRRMEVKHPAEVMTKPHYFATMMVQYGNADGIVGGNSVYPAAFFRPLFHMIAPQPQCRVASSCLVAVDAAQPNFGQNGILFLADCGILPDPSVDELAMIAVETAKLAAALLGRPPRVAMISHSTKGSARTPSAQKMAAATELARKRAHDQFIEADIDGELQVDAALLPEAAKRKEAGGVVAGRADVLIFPDLDAANAASMLMRVAARPQVYGQLILGLAKPAAQVSRVASEETIFGTAVAVGVEAIKYHDLFPPSGLIV